MDKVLTHDELVKSAHSLIEKGEKLDLAWHQLNLALNDTMHGKGEFDILMFYLGCCAMKMGHHALSILLFKKAQESRKDFVAAINNLGYLYKKEGMADLSRSCFDEVIRIVETDTQEIPDADKAEYYTNLGSSMIANGEPAQALIVFEKAFEYGKDTDILRWNRGLAKLELGDYETGWDDYAHGERGDLAKRRLYRVPPLPDWDGTLGKTIVIYGEQGIGDEIMFASMIPDVVKDCNVILDCHPRLRDLFRESFPGLIVYGTRKTECNQLQWLNYHPNIDAKVAIGSLAQFYRKKEADFPRLPYLKANDKLTKKYATKLDSMGRRMKIGFSWKGGIKTTNGNARYIPLDDWLDIFQLDADFISLQYNKDADEEIKAFQDKHDICLNHWPVTMADYDETAGLVANLDLIISVPQSVVHLAGALGTPVWQLAPYRAMWQVGVHGQNMPWYAYSENYWQDKSQNWKPVLTTVKERLCNLLAKITEN